MKFGTIIRLTGAAAILPVPTAALSNDTQTSATSILGPQNMYRKSSIDNEKISDLIKLFETIQKEDGRSQELKLEQEKLDAHLAIFNPTHPAKIFDTRLMVIAVALDADPADALQAMLQLYNIKVDTSNTSDQTNLDKLQEMLTNQAALPEFFEFSTTPTRIILSMPDFLPKNLQIKGLTPSQNKKFLLGHEKMHAGDTKYFTQERTVPWDSLVAKYDFKKPQTLISHPEALAAVAAGNRTEAYADLTLGEMIRVDGDPIDIIDAVIMRRACEKATTHFTTPVLAALKLEIERRGLTERKQKNVPAFRELSETEAFALYDNLVENYAMNATGLEIKYTYDYDMTKRTDLEERAKTDPVVAAGLAFSYQTLSKARKAAEIIYGDITQAPDAAPPVPKNAMNALKDLASNALKRDGTVTFVTLAKAYSRRMDELLAANTTDANGAAKVLQVQFVNGTRNFISNNGIGAAITSTRPTLLRTGALASINR